MSRNDDASHVSYKTLVCIEILAGLLIHDASPAQVKMEVKRLGSGWSLTAVMQYLTGQAALDAFRSLPSDFIHEGLNKVTMGLMIAAAHGYCAGSSQSDRKSSGYFVHEFSGDSTSAHIDKLRLIFIGQQKLNS